MRVLDWRVFAAVSLAWAPQAFSQAYQERPLEWHFNIGAGVPVGETSNYLDAGWFLGGGLQWNPQPGLPWALLAEVSFSTYTATNEAIHLANTASNTVRIDTGWADIWEFNVNGVYKIHLSPIARAYVTGGIGTAHRTVDLSQTVLVGGTYCDPWWGYCYPGVFPGQAIVASESTTRFSWNVGVGFEFPQAGGGSWFIDARFRRIETQHPTEYIPVVVGFRY